jgi:hypothetical protein
MSMRAAPARASTVSQALAPGQARHVRRAGVHPGQYRADDGVRRSDPDRVRGHGPDRHPGRVRRSGRRAAWE